eukprot:TRINITY_DN3369_c0_g1_i1.p1 TRINITY_DN3369_c0_g1~~TRINITY_DN3369_c0_g1_i1.p1  ORF type:complete len:1086 (-),score=231.07 TRINITY_DN3369_c0_g1_i1:765-4022(-)
MSDFGELLKFKPTRCDDELRVCKTDKDVETATFLDCSWKQISVLPECFTGVSNLQEVNLSKNLLSSLPDSFSVMTKLRTMFLDENAFVDLPNCLSLFTNLEVLRVNQNQLSVIPEWLGLLSNVQSLQFNKNVFSSLPQSISQLLKLQTISAEGNNLSSIPIGISYLTNLVSVNFSINNISVLPEGIGKLAKLRSLRLGGKREPRAKPPNLITRLPLSMFNLQALEVLDLQNLAIEFPPQQICDRGVPQILEFLREAALRPHPLYQGRVVVVGEPSSGKTTTIKSLMQKGNTFVSTCNASKTSTLDIDISLDPLVIKAGRTDLSFFMWDFCGAPRFEGLGQFFISTGAIILLVYKMGDESQRQSLRRWANVVATAAPGARIVVVGTHQDLVQSVAEEQKSAELEAIKKLLAPLNTSLKFVDYITISNQNGPSIVKLREKIAEVAMQLPSFNMEFPESFLHMRQIVESVARFKPNASLSTADMQGYIDIFKSDFNLSATLSVLRDIGAVVHINKPGLDERIICHPTYLVRIFRQIYNSSHARGLPGTFVMQHFRGVLDDNFPGLVGDVLDLMRFYNVSFPSSDGTFEIVPYLLAEGAPHPGVWPWQPLPTTPAFAHCELRFKFLPRFAFLTLVAILNRSCAKLATDTNNPAMDEYYSANCMVASVCARKRNPDPTYRFMMNHHKDEKRIYLSVRSLSEKYPAFDCLKHFITLMDRALTRFDGLAIEGRFLICPHCASQQPTLEACGRLPMDELVVDEDERILCPKEQERYTLDEWMEGRVVDSKSPLIPASALYVPDLLAIEPSTSGAESSTSGDHESFSGKTRSRDSSDDAHGGETHHGPSITIRLYCDSWNEPHPVEDLNIRISAKRIIANRSVLHYLLKLWKPQTPNHALGLDAEDIDEADLVQWLVKKGKGCIRLHRTPELLALLDVADPSSQWRMHLEPKMFQDDSARLLCPACTATLDDANIFLSSPSLVQQPSDQSPDQFAMTGNMLYRHTAFYKSWERRFFVLDKEKRELIRFIDSSMRVSSGKMIIEGDSVVRKKETLYSCIIEAFVEIYVSFFSFLFFFLFLKNTSQSWFLFFFSFQ